MESRLLLNVVIRQSATILKLLARKDQPLLVWRDALLVLDLRLHIVDGIRRLDLQSDGLASEGFHEDLHATPEPEHQMECGLLLDIVISKRPAILELFASKDETLLVWRDALLVLDLCLDIVNCVRGLDLKCDGLAGERLHKNLHLDGRSREPRSTLVLRRILSIGVDWGLGVVDACGEQN